MPLENQIQGLTAAVTRLSDILGAMTTQQAPVGGANGMVNVPPKELVSAEPAKVEAKKAAPAEVKAKVAKVEAKPAPEPKDDLEDTTPAVDFEAVKTVLRELGAKMAEVKGATEGRQVVIDLLGKFKVAKAIELKASQYADFIEQAAKLTSGADAGGVEVDESDDLVG